MLDTFSGLSPPNCLPMGLRCSACGQVHLRDGYCQALDSDNPWRSGVLGRKWLSWREDMIRRNQELDPKVYESPVPLDGETLSEPETLTETLSPVEALKSETLSEDVKLSVSDGNGVLCVECGASFVPKRATARFCSDACRLKAHRKD